jgi:hypothetical protein
MHCVHADNIAADLCQAACCHNRSTLVPPRATRSSSQSFLSVVKPDALQVHQASSSHQPILQLNITLRSQWHAHAQIIGNNRLLATYHLAIDQTRLGVGAEFE